MLISGSFSTLSFSLAVSQLNNELQRMRDEHTGMEFEMGRLKGNHTRLRHKFDKLKACMVQRMPLEEHEQILDSMQW